MDVNAVAQQQQEKNGKKSFTFQICCYLLSAYYMEGVGLAAVDTKMDKAQPLAFYD